jgi:lipoprotein-anchoring transpeptidase ErfK/SrfK
VHHFLVAFRARELLAVAVAVGVVTASGCGGDDSVPDATPAPTTPVETEPAPVPSAEPAPACVAGVSRLGSGRVAFAAVVKRPTAAVRSVGGPVVARFGLRNVNGVRSVLGVVAVRRNGACDATWYRVQLPIRPNGSVGWVRASDVRLRRLTTRIVVDLSDRRVTLFRDGGEVLEAKAAIGKPGTPTPTGRYYVNQRLLSGDPAGPFGPGAVGISAFSPTLQDWAQGGPIAIHGTNVPYRLGHAVSHGCVRIANAALLKVFRLASEGTPVLIRS